MKEIVIIGYYDHLNVGDEQYKDTFIYLIKYILGIKDYGISFIDCDKLINYANKINDNDIILAGGGDILNDYFIDTIIKVFNGRKNTLYAISVGIPYTSILTSNKLHIFHSIFIRSYQDVTILKEYHNNVYFIPDISFLLNENHSNHTLLDICTSNSNASNSSNGSNIGSNSVSNSVSDSVSNRESNKSNGNGDSNLLKIQQYYTNYIQEDINFLTKIKKKKICITLSRHIYNEKYKDVYKNIITTFAKFVKYLISSNYHVIFIPFNTNEHNINENDNYIHKDVMNALESISQKIQTSWRQSVTFIEASLSVYEIYSIYNLSYLIIPMRFHGCLFSIYTSTPFLPIYTTRKINNLLIDVSWCNAYKLPVNNGDVPIELNLEVLIFRFNRLTQDYTVAITLLRDINANISKWGENLRHVKIIDPNNNTDLIQDNHAFVYMNNESKIQNDTDPNRGQGSRSEVSQDPGLNNVMIIVKKNTSIEKINDIKNKINKYLSETQSDNIITVDNLYNIKDEKLKNTIVQMTSYYLTDGTINSVYNYGLYEKMFKKDYNINREWLWILENKTAVKLIDNPNGLFNLNYMDQIDYSGVHRSGWQYVYEHISFLHNSNNGLLLDLYLDRTFHWNNNINKILGIIPYTQWWCGFIHHTFDTEFSEYNCYNLLANENFLLSLKYCKCLFVLSDTLCDKLKLELEKLEIKGITVISISHPTEVDVQQFNFINFVKNKDKKIINIGGWLRNIYNFYKLEIPNKITMTTKRENPGFFEKYLNITKKIDYPLKKVILKGINMNNYFPHDNLLPDLFNILTQGNNNGNNNDNISCNISCNVSCNNVSNGNVSNANVSCNGNKNGNGTLVNNWHKHFYNDIKDSLESIHIIEYVDNNTYDNLLNENIVFINLVDASAVNTLIECIVRNTPIIINKIPAVVELLGNNYPLYYEKPSDVYALLTEKTIYNAHKYLKNVNKKKYTISYFVCEFIDYLRSLQV